MAGAAHCSLQAKRLLLDPKFEGYKLSLEPLACYQLGLDAGEERARRGAGPAGHPLGSAGGTDPPAFPFVPSRCSAAGQRPSVQGAPSWGQPGPQQRESRASRTAGVSETERFVSAFSIMIGKAGQGRPSSSPPGGFVVDRGLRLVRPLPCSCLPLVGLVPE